MSSQHMPSEEQISRQQTLLATHRRTLSYYLQRLAITGSAFASIEVLHGIEEARSNIQRIKKTLRAWSVLVEDHPDDGDDVVQSDNSTTSPTNPPPTPLASIDRTKVRQVLTDYFNDEELRDLCFDMNIDYESLPSSNKSGKARELVAYANRRGIYEDLIRAIQSLRPNITWK